jgi:hypothetical protein
LSEKGAFLNAAYSRRAVRDVPFSILLKPPSEAATNPPYRDCPGFRAFWEGARLQQAVAQRQLFFDRNRRQSR